MGGQYHSKSFVSTCRVPFRSYIFFGLESAWGAGSMKTLTVPQQNLNSIEPPFKKR
tara:strand:+ start:262 stop:429 length:168 start_codon:yes stop_codon:yes gene_type:complete